MNHVSIFEKKWLDLVFEGKNKAYGAYQLRRENPRTTMLALLFGLLFLASIISIGLLAARLNSTVPNLTTVFNGNDIVTPVNLPDQPSTPPSKAVTPPASDEDTPENTEQLRDPVIVPEGDEDNVHIINGPVAPDTPPGDGIPGANPTPANPGNPGTSGPGTFPAPTTSEPVLPGLLDKLPEYPGGIKNFYRYVGNNFEKPELDDEKTITVYVAFIIEKDGSMTDIRVLRDPGYGMGKEAIRVLKSNKTNWKAGIKNGQPVRTAYTLPITVNIN